MKSLEVVGKCVLDTKVKEAKGSTPLEFYVLRDNVRPLFGLESCLDLELITLNNKVEQMSMKFEKNSPFWMNFRMFSRVWDVLKESITLI